MYSKGDVVIVQFPFSDLVHAKKRPMLVIGVKGQDLIGCAITSNPDSDGIPLTEFADGSLPLESKIKYWQIHTFLMELAIKNVAKITTKTHTELIRKIDELMKI